MKIEERVVTPEVAKVLLSKNTGNFREADRNRVARYSRDMQTGSWLNCGDPIRISKTGILLDGQHRLKAIVQAGVTLPLVVITDLDDESAMMMDRGQPRTVASWMKHMQVKNAANIATLARAIVVHRIGIWANCSWMTDRITDTDIIAFVELHEKTMQSALHVARIAEKRTYIPTSILATLMHEGAFPKLAEETELCMWFCTALRDGLDLSKQDAVYHLRERFFVDSSGKQSSRRENAFIVRALSVLAWNKTAARDVVKLLRFTPVGPGRTELPKYIANVNGHVFDAHG